METEKLRVVVENGLALGGDDANKDEGDYDDVDSGGEYMNDESTAIRNLSTNPDDDRPARSSPYSSDNEEDQQDHYVEMPAVTLALPLHASKTPIVNNLALERPTTARSPR